MVCMRKGDGYAYDGSRVGVAWVSQMAFDATTALCSKLEIRDILRFQIYKYLFRG